MHDIHTALIRLDYLGDLGMSEMIGLMRLHVQEITRYTSIIASNIMFNKNQKFQLISDFKKYDLDYTQFINETPNSAHLNFVGVYLATICGKIHDIGKPFFRDIYSQDRSLTTEEFKTQKYHSNLTRLIVRTWGRNCNILCDHTNLLNFISDAAASHHEKYDGTGYPEGYSGEDILLIGRLLAITDVISALVNERPYSKPIPLSKCMDILENSKGSHFDPSLVNAVQAIYNLGVFTEERVRGKWIEKEKFSNEYKGFIRSISFDDENMHGGDKREMNRLKGLIDTALLKQESE